MQRTRKFRRRITPAIAGVEEIGDATTLTTGGSRTSMEDKRTPYH